MSLWQTTAVCLLMCTVIEIMALVCLVDIKWVLVGVTGVVMLYLNVVEQIKPQLDRDNITFSSLLVSVQLCVCLPMSKWRYEVEAAVHPVVHYVSSV